MDHISTAQLVLGVTAAFTIGLGVGAAFAVLMVKDSLRAIREERELIDRWDRRTSTDLIDRLTAMDPEPEPDPPAEVIVPTVADISIVDNRPWALDRVLAAAVLMGTLMERGQRGPVRYGRHSGEHNAAGHELLVALLTKTQALRTIGSEVA